MGGGEGRRESEHSHACTCTHANVLAHVSTLDRKAQWANLINHSVSFLEVILLWDNALVHCQDLLLLLV